MFKALSIAFAAVAVFGQEVPPVIAQTQNSDVIQNTPPMIPTGSLENTVSQNTGRFENIVNPTGHFENNVGQNTGRFEHMVNPTGRFMDEDHFDNFDVGQFENENADDVHDFEFDIDEDDINANGMSSGPNVVTGFGQGPIKGGYGQAPLKGGYGQAPLKGGYGQGYGQAPLKGGYGQAPLKGNFGQF